MGGQSDTAERLLARIAGSEHGVVTRAQLLGSGVSARQIERRLDKGSLLREYPGVYRVGHRAPSVEAAYLAAVKACGKGAVLSGRAAGHLLRLLKGVPPPPEVTAPTRRQVKGIRTRRSRTSNCDRTLCRAIPVTTVPRTLVDVAGELTAEQLARACHEAGVLHRTTPAEVEAVLTHRPNAPGATKLRQVLRGEIQVTLSELERAFLRLLRRAGLPSPIANKPAGGRRVDCRWPGQRLTVELDSYRYHSSRHSWEQDRRREREARSRGDEFRRFTYADVFEETGYMLGELRKLLSATPSRSRRP